MKPTIPLEDEEFKEQVINYVRSGKYARALGLLQNKVKDLIFDFSRRNKEI